MPHLWHLCLAFAECTELRCLCKTSLNPKLAEHLSQTNGLSFKWTVRMCLRKLPMQYTPHFSEYLYKLSQSIDAIASCFLLYPLARTKVNRISLFTLHMRTLVHPERAKSQTKFVETHPNLTSEPRCRYYIEYTRQLDSKQLPVEITYLFQKMFFYNNGTGMVSFSREQPYVSLMDPTIPNQVDGIK